MSCTGLFLFGSSLKSVVAGTGMPPCRKRAAAPTIDDSTPGTRGTSSGGGGGVCGSKRLKPTGHTSTLTTESIRAAIEFAIGTGAEISQRGMDGLPIPQLVQIIASYAAPFVSIKTSVAVTITGFNLLWVRDGQVIGTGSCTTNFLQLPIRSGTCVDVSGECVCTALPTRFDCLRLPIETGAPVAVTRFCGSDGVGFAMGNRSSAVFREAAAVCADPLNPNGFFLADQTSIRYFDEAKDEVTLFTGSDEPGEDDDIGMNARFGAIVSLLIASDGRTLWCGQAFGGLRRIDTASRAVTTQYQIGAQALCWDRLPTVKRDSAFYCLIRSYDRMVIGRFDSLSQTLKSFRLAAIGGSIHALVSTPSGHVLFAARYPTSGVYSLDPSTSQIEELDFVCDPYAQLLLDDSARTLITVNSAHLMSHTLPSRYFPLPKCCDRDL